MDKSYTPSMEIKQQLLKSFLSFLEHIPNYLNFTIENFYENLFDFNLEQWVEDFNKSIIEDSLFYKNNSKESMDKTFESFCYQKNIILFLEVSKNSGNLDAFYRQQESIFLKRELKNKIKGLS